MDKQIQVGVGVMIKKGEKVLLGHRCTKCIDTGGIYEPDSWTFPGGKQEYDETVIECAIREVKEETGLVITNPKIIGVQDDIGIDRHFVTVLVVAEEFDGEVQVMEPDKIDEWKWYKWDELPKILYGPTKKYVELYRENLVK